MPKILWKDLFIEIRHSLGRFLSILLIVALGVAFFAGIKGASPDMKNSADSYFDQYHMQDIQVYSTLGITEEDIEALKKVKNVESVIGTFSQDFLASQDNRESVVKVISWNPEQTVNIPRLMEGRMPEKESECVIEADSVNNELFGSYAIGDTITLKSGTDEPLSDSLKNDTYTITGKVYNPNYLSYEKGTSSIGSGSVDTFIYVLQSDIAADYYTEADLTVKGAAALDTYSDAYFDVIDPVVDEVELLAEKQIADRKEKLQSELDERRKEADDRLNDAEIQIADGQKALDQAAADIQNGLNEIQKNEEKLAASEQELAQGWNTWNSGKASIEDGLNQVNSGLSQIESAQARLPELQSARSQLQQAQEGLRQTDQALSGLNQLDSGIRSLAEQILGLKSADPQNPALPVMENQLNTLIEQEKQIIQGLGLPITWTEVLPPALPEQPQEPSKQPDPDKDQTDSDAEEQPDSPDMPQSPDTPQNPPAVDPIQIPDISQAVQALTAQQEAIIAQAGNSGQIAASLQEIEAGIAQIQSLGPQAEQLQNTRNQLLAAQAELPAALETLNRAQQQIDEGKAQIDEARAELDDGQKKYESGLNELREQQQKFEEERAKVRRQLKDAQTQIDDLNGEWIVLDRDSHYSYRDYQSAAERMEGIAEVFPVFFFLVAALVCMTTMTRMVDEQRSEIGTLKALGYTKGQIAFKYLAYAGLASILGCVLGLCIGMLVFPYIIFWAWNTMYNLPSIEYVWQPALMLQASATVTGIVLLATFYSIYKELLEVPAQLMRPKAARAGKKILLERIPWLWNRVSFLHKVTLRNIFRYKKRFFMTVIGISGCSALLVAGFGLNDSISSIVSNQYENIYHYDASVSVDLDENPDLVDEIRDLPGITRVFESKTLPVTFAADHKDLSCTLNIISDPAEFESFMTFIPMENSPEAMKLEDSGVFIAIKTAEKMNAAVGDEIEFETADNQVLKAKVTGIFDQNVGHQIYVTEDLYRTWNVKEEEIPTILLETDSDDSEFEKDLGNRLMTLDGVRSVSFYSDLKKNFSDMIASIKLVVLVLVLSAAMLAFVVLYNLSNVNISERQREIATIKVLGFTEKEVNQYVNRESLVLAIIGALAGLLLGIVLHGMIMSLAELDDVRFGRVIYPQSFVYSAALTILFALMVNWIMKFKLRKIEMVESLKAVE